MKVKVRPEDFVVEEVLAAPVLPQPAAFRVYRLRKRTWDTFDLVPVLARRLGVASGDVSLGGIKDRHGDTTQHLAVPNRPGLPDTINEKNYSLESLGYSRQPLSAKGTRGNRFQIVLRDIPPARAEAVRSAAATAGRDGFPNYYDDQRFGSARHGRGFMGKWIFLGERERALRLFFEPSRWDPARERVLKAAVLDNWGRWHRVLEQSFGPYRKVLDVLATEGFDQSFTRALGAIDGERLLMVLNAYQSYLFNEILSRRLARLESEHGLIVRRHRYLAGDMLFPESLPPGLRDELAALRLPVPAFDSEVDDPLTRQILGEVLAAEGIRLEQLRVRKLPGLSIHAVDRPAWVLPEGLAAAAPEPDELYPDRRRITLEFFLPRGAYATVLIKRLGG